MRITKLGHCCLLIEVNGKRILTDPGRFSTAQNLISAIDLVLITHEHADHLHVESLKEVLKNNPHAEVAVNGSVGKILESEGIAFRPAQDEMILQGIPIEAFEATHEEIYKELGRVENTAFMIDNTLLYPGDSFFDPKRPVKILALPVAGPWCRMADALQYAISLKPKKAFPVHDGIMRDDAVSIVHYMPGKVLPDNGIEFIEMKAGDSKEF